MKAKLKSANGTVRFLLQHGEKIGIALVLLVAGLLIWKSMGRDKLGDEKQPEALKAKARAADDHVRNMTWDMIPEIDRTDVTKHLRRPGDTAITPVEPGVFPPISQFNPPVLDPVKLRTDPVLLTVTDLEARGGAGLWPSANPEVVERKMRDAIKKAQQQQKEADEEAERLAREAEDEGRGRRPGRRRDDEGFRGGEGMSGLGAKTKDGAIVITPQSGVPMQGFEEIRNASWVTVLAKVPIKQQWQMYEDALATARNFSEQADAPKYFGYFVQRAEVTDAGQGEWRDLGGVGGPSIIKEMSRWPNRQPAPDPVNPKYIHPLLTFPLPPMVMRQWGEEITHSDLPLPTPEDLMGGAETEEAVAPPAAKEGEEETPFGKVAQPQQPGMYPGGEMRGMGMESRGMFGESRMMGGMSGRGGEMFGGEAESFGRGYGMGMGSLNAGSPEQIQLPEHVWDRQTKFVLFRYFDSTVEPGRRYRYRVRLMFVDVNYGRPPADLDPEVSKRLVDAKANPPKGIPAGTRLSEWSEPSPVAVVPQPGLIYIAEAKAPKSGSGEPEAKLVVKSLDSAHAAEIAFGDWFTRGSVLNSRQKAQIIWSSLYEVDPEEPEESPTFDFLTGLTLLDFEGGEELWKQRSVLAPARALVMDSSGRMMLKTELKDETAVREYEAVIQASEAAAREQRDRGDERRGGRGRDG